MNDLQEQVMTGPQVCGQDASDRLMGQVMQSTPPTVPLLTRQQVAVVLHALADYTALQNATTHTGTDDVPLNVGRWLHAVGDQLENR